MKLSLHGQALVEYLLLLVFLAFMGINIVSGFNDFITGSIGNLSHVLSINLTVGVCETDCFFNGYANGYGGN